MTFRLPGLDQETIRPCIQVRPSRERTCFGQTSDGQAVLTRYVLGDGSCWLLTDPIHLDSSERAPGVRRRVLKAILDAGTNLEPIPAMPDADWLHVMEQPTERGKVHVVYNTKLESRNGINTTSGNGGRSVWN